MTGAVLKVTLDQKRLVADVESRFMSLQSSFDGFVRARLVPHVQKMLVDRVADTRLRPKAPPGVLPQPHVGLAKALSASTYHVRSAGTGTALVVGDAKVLDTLAVYWRAIEYGSDHIVGRTVYGFAGDGGVNAPNAGAFRNDFSTVSGRQAIAAGITPNQFRMVRTTNPIPEHKILRAVTAPAISAFRAEFQNRLTTAFEGRARALQLPTNADRI